jgi:phosphotriesterase-related protein
MRPRSGVTALFRSSGQARDTYRPQMHRSCSFQDFFDQKYIEQFAPNWCYEHVPRDVLPALKAAGVSDRDINTMMVENPKKVFSKIGGY